MAVARSARPAPTRLITPDGRYIVVRGRLWRSANPDLSPDHRDRLVAALMTARRSVAAANRSGEQLAQAAAHADVAAAKLALGERGAPWWNDGAPDLNRRLVRNTAYAAWFAERQPGGDGSSASSAAP